MQRTVTLWPVCSSVPISVTARRGQRCPRRGGRGQRGAAHSRALEGGERGLAGRKEGGGRGRKRSPFPLLPHKPAPRACRLRGAVASTLEQGWLWGRCRSWCVYALQSPRPAGWGVRGLGPAPCSGLSQAFLATCGPHGKQLGWRDRAWLLRAWQSKRPHPCPPSFGGRGGLGPGTSPETVLPLAALADADPWPCTLASRGQLTEQDEGPPPGVPAGRAGQTVDPSP